MQTLGGDLEQKHHVIFMLKCAGKTTCQNRWPIIFRQIYMQLHYWMENKYANRKYLKNNQIMMTKMKQSRNYCEINT